jgi:hypothetical protein
MLSLGRKFLGALADSSNLRMSRFALSSWATAWLIWFISVASFLMVAISPTSQRPFRCCRRLDKLSIGDFDQFRALVDPFDGSFDEFRRVFGRFRGALSQVLTFSATG